MLELFKKAILLLFLSIPVTLILFAGLFYSGKMTSFGGELAEEGIPFVFMETTSCLPGLFSLGCRGSETFNRNNFILDLLFWWGLVLIVIVIIFILYRTIKRLKTKTSLR